MPPPDKRATGTSEEWLTHAKSDLNLARLAVDRKDILPEQVCFHAQQAAEKAFKAVLLFKHVEFPFIHDIDELIEIAEQRGVSIPPEVAQADSLTPFAAETRYPGHGDEIAPMDVGEAIRLADRVVTWASKTIQIT